MIQVALVEDSKEVRESLSLIINGTEGYSCKAAFSSAEEALSSMAKINPDVVLMDINLPGKNGIQCTLELKRHMPLLQIIMLTMYDESEMVFDALKAGATGYLLKRTPPLQILEAVKEVYEGGSPMSMQIARLVVQSFSSSKGKTDIEDKLTYREQEILFLLSKGKRYKEIADQLFISVETVRSHCRKIYEKLQVRSAREAIFKYGER